MVRRVRFLRVHFWSAHDQYWMGLDGTKWDKMGPRSTLRYQEVPKNTEYPEAYQSIQKCLRVPGST